MDTEDNQGKGYSAHRIVAASTVVLAFVGPAMNSILQPGPNPWWIFGVIAIGLITAMLILVLPGRWKNIWHSVFGLPGWFRSTYYWKRYGPKYSIGRPIVCSEVLENTTTVRYTANVELSVRNRDIYSLRVNVDSLKVWLEQKSGWEKLSVQLMNHTGIGPIELLPLDSREFQVVASMDCIGDPKHWPNLQNHYDRGVQGIYVTFRGNTRHLHEGAKRQLRQESVRII